MQVTVQMANRFDQKLIDKISDWPDLVVSCWINENGFHMQTAKNSHTSWLLFRHRTNQKSKQLLTKQRYSMPADNSLNLGNIMCSQCIACAYSLASHKNRKVL